MNDELATQEDPTFRASLKQSPIPSCFLDLKVMRRLLDALNDSCKQVGENEAAALQQGTLVNEEFHRIKQSIRDSYKINVTILGSRGEYFASTLPSLLDDSRLPDTITRITLDSAFLYRANFKMEPLNRINLILDFTKASFFDFSDQPSASLKNSYVEVIGQRESWVNGVYQQIMETFKERATSRRWLHTKGMYSVILWLVAVPISFWNFHKVTSTYPQIMANLSPVLSVFASIYFFILVLVLWRTVYNYARWVFPYLELATSLKSRSSKHRIFLIGLLVTIVYTMLSDLLINILGYLL
jgi:hypothetical protein